MITVEVRLLLGFSAAVEGSSIMAKMPEGAVLGDIFEFLREEASMEPIAKFLEEHGTSPNAFKYMLVFLNKSQVNDLRRKLYKGDIVVISPIISGG
jgi:hypothetical protein